MTTQTFIVKYIDVSCLLVGASACMISSTSVDIVSMSAPDTHSPSEADCIEYQEKSHLWRESIKKDKEEVCSFQLERSQVHLPNRPPKSLPRGLLALVFLSR